MKKRIYWEIMRSALHLILFMCTYISLNMLFSFVVVGGKVSANDNKKQNNNDLRSKITLEASGTDRTYVRWVGKFFYGRHGISVLLFSFLLVDWFREKFRFLFSGDFCFLFFSNTVFFNVISY